MTRLHETIQVARTAADCFAYLKDFSTTEQWEPGTWRAEKITPGKPAPGSEFRLILNGLVRSKAGRQPMTYLLRELRAPSDSRSGLIVLTGKGKGFTATDTITISPIDEHHTEIDYVAELELSGPADKFEAVVNPLLERMGKKAVVGMQTALTPPNAPNPLTMGQKLANRSFVLAMADYTERGYLRMPNMGLSERMDGQTVVITGPTSGLGLATACELSRLGARLILIGRDHERLEQARANVVAFSGANADSVRLIEADLALMANVTAVADELLASEPQIDVLINNAGAMFNQRIETAEGIEQTLAILLLSPFLLTEKLMPRLLESRAHVINISSGGMYLQGLKLSDLQMQHEPYDGTKAYARAKRGLVAITEHWAEQHAGSGARFNSMHPGWAATPGVAKALPTFNKRLEGRLRDSRMGADTICWLASSATCADQNGKFWFDRQAHPTALLPNTAVTAQKRARLMTALHDLIQ